MHDIRKRVVGVVLAAILTSVVATGDPIEAALWPVPIATTNPSSVAPPPYIYPGTGNQWCPRMQSGSYSTTFFGQAQSWVSFGGTCNALWGAYRPAGWMTVSVYRWVGSVSTGSGWVSNAYNQHTVQANIASTANATAYSSSAQIYNGQTTYFFSRCVGGCGS